MPDDQALLKFLTTMLKCLYGRLKSSSKNHNQPGSARKATKIRFGCAFSSPVPGKGPRKGPRKGKKNLRKGRGKEAYANAAWQRLQTALHETIVSNTVKQ